jgi:hypothetical protein
MTGEYAGRTYELYPDANMDLLFELSGSGGRAFLYGPLTRAGFIRVRGDCEYFGIRLRPGARPLLVDVGAAELADNSVALHDLFGADLTALCERLRALPSVEFRKLVF